MGKLKNLESDQSDTNRTDECFWAIGFLYFSVFMVTYWLGYNLGNGEIKEFISRGWPFVSENIIPVLLILFVCLCVPIEWLFSNVKIGYVSLVGTVTAVFGVLIGVLLGWSTII